MGNSKKELATKVSILYYDQKQNQNEIAQKLNISRSYVSQLLNYAKDNDIVRTYVNIDAFHPRMVKEETEMNLLFPEVQQFYIMKSNDSQTTREQIGKFAIPFVSKMIKLARTITIDPGTSVRKVIEALPGDSFEHCQDKIIFPITGGLGNEKIGLHANQHVQKLGNMLKCQYYFLNCPAIVSNKKVRDALIQEVNIQQVVHLWNHVDLALLGIGNVQEGCTAFSILNDGMIQMLKDGPAVADIAMNFFDQDGQYLGLLDDFRISISLKNMQNAQAKMLIGFGSEKAKAIVSVLKAKIIDFLITDSITIEAIKHYLHHHKTSAV